MSRDFFIYNFAEYTITHGLYYNKKKALLTECWRALVECDVFLMFGFFIGQYITESSYKELNGSFWIRKITQSLVEDCLEFRTIVSVNGVQSKRNFLQNLV